MELLSPAGNLISAYSAFKGGADAIYIGGKQFSARASADNFSNDEIKEIVFFAHSIGKKVYVTLNTLLFQDEFFDAVAFAKFLYKINVDGVIIQDLGLANYLHKTLPDLPLNASTQLNCHNLEQAKALIKIGFKRIVLAREVNLETAKAIKNLGVEVEVFGHGALCVSYSGNCLLSSFIGGRSGNRGRCAQPCRMRYDLLEDGVKISEDSFAISTKDLMTINFMDKFIGAGIDSLKIEGRLKSNEYIYAVSKAYRHAIDAVVENKTNKDKSVDIENLIKIFNRQFTRGYILDESPFKVINSATSSHQGEVIGKVIRINKNRVSILLKSQLNRLDGIRFNGKEQIGLTVEKMFLNKESVEAANNGQVIEIIGVENADKLNNLEVIKTKDYALTKQIENELKQQLKVKVVGKFFAVPNAPIALTLSFNNKEIMVKGDVALVAEGSGTTEERIADQLKKSGDYPYTVELKECKLQKCFIPISAINDLRNKAFEALKNALITTNKIKDNGYKNSEVLLDYPCKTNFFVENSRQQAVVTDNDYFAYSQHGDVFKNNTRVTSNCEFNKPYEVVHFVVENRNNNYLIASQYCSITNSYSLDAFYELGFKECVLSPELDFESTNALISDFKTRHNALPNVGFIVYGKLDMMIMRSCPIGTVYKNKDIHCGKCHKNKYELVDRIGEKYHVIGDANCNVRILNNHPIYLFDRLDELSEIGVTNIWFVLTDEGEEKTSEIIARFENNKSEFDRFNFTRGHYNKRPL